MNNVIPDSKVRFLKNVPFSNTYRNVMDFTSLENQSSYFLGLDFIEFDRLTYVRNNGALKVGKSKDEMLQYNYMMFQNQAFSNKWFYAFVTNVSYVSRNCCLVNFEIDVWQTWLFQMQLQPSFIERKHCKRWNEDGSPVINTIPEGLEIGSEYVVKNVRYSMNLNLNNQVYWIVFATTTDYGVGRMIGGVPNIITYLYYPISINKRLINPDSEVAWGVSNVNGESLNCTPIDLLDLFRNDPNYVKNLVGCYVTDYVPFKYNVTSSSVNGGVTLTSDYLSFVDIGNYKVPILALNKIRYFDLNSVYPQKYYNLTNEITESKLLMYPYSYVELTDFQGNVFKIKNEYVTGNDISINTLGSVEGNQKVAYVVNNYLNNNKIYNKLDYGIINAEPHNLTVIDDYSAAYLQGNANTIRQSISNTIAQSDVNGTVAAENSVLNKGITKIQNRANVMSSAYQDIVGLDILAPRAVIAMIEANAQNQIAEAQGELNVNQALRQGELNNEIAISSALAKMQDIKNVADTAHLQGGNTGFTIGNNIHGYALVSKQITPEYIEILTDYFQKYGYAYHRVEIPVLRTRQSWDYIQTTGCNVIGNIPQVYIDSLESIFDNGVTIWHNSDVGNYNQSNNEI